MKQIKKTIKNHKIKVIVMSILLLLSIAFLVFMRNNHFLYSDYIIRVIEVNETRLIRDDGEHVSPYYLQQIRARVMNGDARGKIVEFETERSYSGLLDYNLRVGNEIFVDRIEDISTANILNIKRDFHIALITIIFLLLLIFIASMRSLLMIITMIINILIFILVTYLRADGYNVLLLFSIATIFFTVITILITCGINKKSLGAILSTLLSVVVMMLIAYFVIEIQDIRFETMDFLPYLPDFHLIFFSSLLIGGLGAIMDTAVLMATSINELIYRNPKIKAKDLKESAWEVAQDTTGTSMNVLFYASIIGMIPIIIFFVANAQDLTFISRYWLSIEVIRALVGSIGIVLVVPISYVVNLWLWKRWQL